MRMRCMRIFPEMWANTLWPFSSSTRNMALGRGSMTVPSRTIASSLDFGRGLLLVLLWVPRLGARMNCRKGAESRLNMLARHLTGENSAHEQDTAAFWAAACRSATLATVAEAVRAGGVRAWRGPWGAVAGRTGRRAVV